jgi:adenylate cyclase class 2
MSVETEVKVVLEDVEEFQRRLRFLKAGTVLARHFEDNLLLDYPDGRVRAQGRLVRVRLTEWGCFLTYKGPPHPAGNFKSREELETRVEDGSIVLRILEQLGLQLWFRYQKYREEYVLAARRTEGREVYIAVDATPIGDFAELEGAEADIREVAAEIGLKESQFLRDSYYSLYYQFCQKRGEPATNMIFPSGAAGVAAAGGEDVQ